MAENEVKISVTADDQASQVIVDAAAKAEAAMKQLAEEQKLLDQQTKQTFRNTKASTEFFAQIANIAGGSQIAAMAGQMASLTEKTSQFSEVAKEGGAGAFAFQAGIVAASAAIGYQAGTALHNFIFDTQASVEAMEEAAKQADRLQKALQSRLQRELQDRQALIELAGDEASVEQAKVDEILRINDEIQKANDELAKLTTERDDLLRRSNPLNTIEGDTRSGAEKFQDWATGDSAARAEQTQKTIDAEKERQKILIDQRNEMQRQLGIGKQIADLRQERADASRSEDFVEGLQERLSQLQSQLEGTTNLTEVIKNTVNADREVAAELLKEIENTQQKIKEKQEEEATTKRLDDLKKRELERLEEERILLEHGAEAAHAFRLEKQGMAKADAEAIAAEQARLNAQKKQKDDKLATNAILQNIEIGTTAMESRLLSRAPVQNKSIDKIADNTKATKEELEKLNDRLASGGLQESPKLMVVG
jgi:hypothetical protein